MPPVVSVITGVAVVPAAPNVSLPAKVTVPAEIVAVLALFAPTGPETGVALVVTLVQPALGQVPSPPFQVKSSARGEPVVTRTAMPTNHPARGSRRKPGMEIAGRKHIMKVPSFDRRRVKSRPPPSSPTPTARHIYTQERSLRIAEKCPKDCRFPPRWPSEHGAADRPGSRNRYFQGFRGPDVPPIGPENPDGFPVRFQPGCHGLVAQAGHHFPRGEAGRPGERE